MVARLDGVFRLRLDGYANGGLEIQRFNSGTLTTLAKVTSAYNPGTFTITLVCLGAVLKGQLLVLTGFERRQVHGERWHVCIVSCSTP